jgi:hypothetical protein
MSFQQQGSETPMVYLYDQAHAKNNGFSIAEVKGEKVKFTSRCVDAEEVVAAYKEIGCITVGTFSEKEVSNFDLSNVTNEDDLKFFRPGLGNQSGTDSILVQKIMEEIRKDKENPINTTRFKK